MAYTIAQVKQLLSMAKQLGFQDDIEHWTAELKKLEEGS